MTINEQDWLQATDPQPMLDFLCETGRADERKLRLFAVACCRRLWHLLQDKRSEGALEVVERWADGNATAQELLAAHEAAWEARGTPARTAVADASDLHWYAGSGGIAASHVAWAGTGRSRADERRAQAVILRDIVGNPFRHLSLDPSWLHWRDGLVRQLAEAAYQRRQMPVGPLDPARLAVLADAFEEAGCADAHILVHLRCSEPHVRGCHLLDAILGTRGEQVRRSRLSAAHS